MLRLPRINTSLALRNGDTGLHVAAYRQMVDTVGDIIYEVEPFYMKPPLVRPMRQGVDVMATNQLGLTPLHYARGHGPVLHLIKRHPSYREETHLGY